jgi:hypothetical protein
MSDRIGDRDVGFIARWILSTLFGHLMGASIFIVTLYIAELINIIVDISRPFSSFIQSVAWILIVAGLVGGFIAGGIQQIIIRRRTQLDLHWTRSCLIAWGVGSAFYVVVLIISEDPLFRAPLLMFFSIGTVSSIIQSIEFRQYLDKKYIWIVLTLIGWLAIGVAYYWIFLPLFSLFGLVIAGVVGFLVLGSISGVALERIILHPKLDASS